MRTLPAVAWMRKMIPHAAMRRIFLFLLSSVALAQAGPPVKATREDKQIVFRAGTAEMFRYQAEPMPLPRPQIAEAFIRGGYLSPLLTPSGKQISDDFPPNHIPHHGVW